MADCQVPTDEHYKAAEQDWKKRHPKAHLWVLEHVIALMVFLDISIIVGFSYGVAKAVIAVTKGKLLGHVVARRGGEPDEERVEAIKNFAPLKEPSHVRQFLGSVNWLRTYLAPCYAAAVKCLVEFATGKMLFPTLGLGAPSENSSGSKAVKVIKVLCIHYIKTSVLD